MPSRNSRLAPPPVEQWVILSATLNFLAAVAVSLAQKMAGVYAPSFVCPKTVGRTGGVEFECILRLKARPAEGAVRRVPLWG
mgnify:CR=1 FL=1